MCSLCPNSTASSAARASSNATCVACDESSYALVEGQSACTQCADVYEQQFAAAEEEGEAATDTPNLARKTYTKREIRGMLNTLDQAVADECRESFFVLLSDAPRRAGGGGGMATLVALALSLVGSVALRAHAGG